MEGERNFVGAYMATPSSMQIELTHFGGLDGALNANECMRV